jgi:hypothetical protein
VAQGRAKVHLEKLKRLTGGFGKELLTIFPTVTEEKRCRFQLLRRAYTEARYEPGYRIEKEDLDYLGERIRRLQEAVKPLCARRIEQYEEEARPKFQANFIHYIFGIRRLSIVLSPTTTLRQKNLLSDM